MGILKYLLGEDDIKDVNDGINHAKAADVPNYIIKDVVRRGIVDKYGLHKVKDIKA